MISSSLSSRQTHWALRKVCVLTEYSEYLHCNCWLVTCLRKAAAAVMINNVVIMQNIHTSCPRVQTVSTATLVMELQLVVETREVWSALGDYKLSVAGDTLCLIGTLQ